MKLAKSTLAALALLLMFGLASCSKTDTSSPLAPSNSNALTSQVILPATDIAIPSTLTDATTQVSFSLAPPPPIGGDSSHVGDDTTKRDPHRRMGDMGGMGKLGKGHFDRGGFFHIGFIFKDLNLTADQQAQIKTFMQARIDCQKALQQQLRDSEKPILDEANAARQVIIDQLKAGTITKEEAQTQLKALRDATKAKLEANPLRAEILAALIACEDTFFDNVGSILDPTTQKPLWDDFVTKYKALRDLMKK